MKNTLLVLAVILFPLLSMAQPTIRIAEEYSIGDTIKFGDCPPTAAGAAGAAVTWNFSSLALTDTGKLWIIANPAGSAYPSANIVERYSDSTYVFVNKTAPQNNVVGQIDSSVAGANNAVAYTNMLTVQRPFTYGTTVTDTYTVSSVYMGVPVSGPGTITLTGDGYGTLSLPTGTFSNILRVKSIQYFGISLLGGAGSISASQHSYIWYDTSGTVPLLRIDSLADTTVIGTSTINSSVSVKYFLSAHHTLNTPAINTANISTLKGNISNDQLSLFYAFDQNEVYDVAMYDITGRKIFSNEFIAGSNIQRFDAANQLAPGAYFVSLAKKNDPASQQIIKVTK